MNAARRDRVDDVIDARDIPFGLSAATSVPRPRVPAASKGAIIVDLLRQLVAARRKAATWRYLTHCALDALAALTDDRDRLRRRYYALLDDRRRARSGTTAAIPREDHRCVSR